MLTVFFRTLIIYILLIAAMRLMGKRQIGELQITELVITFMLSELAVIPISNKEIPVLHAIVPIILLLSLEVILSYAETKSKTLKLLFSGNPAVIIAHGKLNTDQMTKNRIQIEELLGELRLKGAFDINDVEYALLEENGKLSVLLKSQASPLKPSQLNFPVTEKGNAHPIVIDGEIDYNSLVTAGRTENWLRAFISSHKTSLEDVFLMTVDDSGEINLFITDNSGEKKSIKQKHYKSSKKDAPEDKENQ